ncbi:MAG TPA: Flp family type IVb pilin, partial [Balneolales bacterium]|nr:Flp family type IVb pilin [Balneolales bacterium]
MMPYTPHKLEKLKSKSTRLSRFFFCFMRGESGVTAIEYGILAALIAVVIIAALVGLGLSLGSSFNDTGNAIVQADSNHNGGGSGDGGTGGGSGDGGTGGGSGDGGTGGGSGDGGTGGGSG